MEEFDGDLDNSLEPLLATGDSVGIELSTDQTTNPVDSTEVKPAEVEKNVALRMSRSHDIYIYFI